MIDPDMTTLAQLEAQLRQLSAVLDRLARARSQLVPVRATFWGGDARVAYDAAISDLAGALDATFEIVQLARQNTRIALTEGTNRG